MKLMNNVVPFTKGIWIFRRVRPREARMDVLPGAVHIASPDDICDIATIDVPAVQQLFISGYISLFNNILIFILKY